MITRNFSKEFPRPCSLRVDCSEEFVYHKERFPIKNTAVINFKTTPGYEDPVATDACVRVLTSDGEVGTCSHLVFSIDPEVFAQDLSQLLGKKGVPVVLNGGMGESNRSRALTIGLRKSLASQGFVISDDPRHSDVLGGFTRKAILTSGEVIVTRIPYGDDAKPETLHLTFPKG